MENNLFDKFLRQYILDIIECSDKEYDIDDKDIKEIIENINYNEHVWEVFNTAVVNQLDEYTKGE